MNVSEMAQVALKMCDQVVSVPPYFVSGLVSSEVLSYPVIVDRVLFGKCFYPIMWSEAFSTPSSFTRGKAPALAGEVGTKNTPPVLQACSTRGPSTKAVKVWPTARLSQ